jgi:hypothetical protein
MERFDGVVTDREIHLADVEGYLERASAFIRGDRQLTPGG